MIVLLYRGFSGTPFLTAVAGTDAAFLARVSAAREPPLLTRFDDGSYLSRFGGVEVRIIECEITITTSQGCRTGLSRLVTNLLDHHRYPASDLVSLYQERWEVDSAYFAIKKSVLGRRVLRSKTWTGIAQEVYSLLSAYQVLRIAIADATETTPGAEDSLDVQERRPRCRSSCAPRDQMTAFVVGRSPCAGEGVK